jgi:hypothetical protein
MSWFDRNEIAPLPWEKMNSSQVWHPTGINAPKSFCRAFLESLSILGTCIKDAPEFATGGRLRK